MSATIYGFTATDYKARPDFTARRDAKGAWSASNSFTMLRDTWEDSAREQFLKGRPIVDLYPELNSYWSFLELEEVDLQSQPGEHVIVHCVWTGWTEAEYDEKEDVTYTLSGTRVERSILLHPLFIKEMAKAAKSNRENMVAAFNGHWAVDETEDNTAQDMYFYNVADRGRAPWHITEEVVIKWARVIFEQGHRTYKAPTLQWTCETASLTGWKDGDTDKLALVEYGRDPRPPGNPPMPQFGDFEWLKISMNQTLTRGRAVQSQTWELSPPGGFHRFPGEGFEGKGLYNYDLSELDVA